MSLNQKLFGIMNFSSYQEYCDFFECIPKQYVVPIGLRFGMYLSDFWDIVEKVDELEVEKILNYEIPREYELFGLNSKIALDEFMKEIEQTSPDVWTKVQNALLSFKMDCVTFNAKRLFLAKNKKQMGSAYQPQGIVKVNVGRGNVIGKEDHFRIFINDNDF